MLYKTIFLKISNVLRNLSAMKSFVVKNGSITYVFKRVSRNICNSYIMEHLRTAVSTEKTFLKKLQIYSKVVSNQGNTKNTKSDFKIKFQFKDVVLPKKLLNRFPHLELFSNILKKPEMVGCLKGT